MNPTDPQYAHNELVFESLPFIDDEASENRRRLAIMLSAIERKQRPWCEHCNQHKVQRMSKEKDSPYDSYCGICSRIAVEKGPKYIDAFHAVYCSSCRDGKDKPAESIE